MRRACVAIAVLVWSGTASADDTVSASEQAEHATLVFVGTELMPMPTVGAHVDAEGAVRVHRDHFAFEGRFGGGLAFSATAGGNVFGLRAGASAGYAIPLGARFVVIPMLAYDAFVLRERHDSAELVQRATFHMPISWLVYPHAVVELSGQIGVQWFQGIRDLAIVLAPRIGLVF